MARFGSASRDKDEPKINQLPTISPFGPDQCLRGRSTHDFPLPRFSWCPFSPAAPGINFNPFFLQFTLPRVLKVKPTGESGAEHFNDVITSFFNAWIISWEEVLLKSPSKPRYKSLPFRQTETVGSMMFSFWCPGPASMIKIAALMISR
jgi:hypothetical protein